MPDDIALAQQGDEALMLAYAANNTAAFDVLYARHKDAVFRYFLRQQYSQAHAQDVSTAEELCHDCWLKIIHHRSTYQTTAKFTTWLFTIARHTAIDYFKKKHLQMVETGHEMDEKLNPSQQDDEPNAKEQDQLRQALKTSIALLPVQQRQIFLLKQEGGFSLDDIALMTQQNKEKVKSSWRYALQKLRKGLFDYV
ncbi:MAG: sigma-70 family RNA polymerase sigma factor [Pseudomonadales bacterium]|nr:sigma-70 family RNA polymerase sigma factor [Pseudomonadales bacterium]